MVQSVRCSRKLLPKGCNVLVFGNIHDKFCSWRSFDKGTLVKVDVWLNYNVKLNISLQRETEQVLCVRKCCWDGFHAQTIQALCCFFRLKCSQWISEVKYDYSKDQRAKNNIYASTDFQDDVCLLFKKMVSGKWREMLFIQVRTTER